MRRTKNETKRRKGDDDKAMQPRDITKLKLLEDDSLKGDEELHLENLLFGKRHRQGEPVEHNLQHITDSELFFVDERLPQATQSLTSCLTTNYSSSSDTEEAAGKNTSTSISLAARHSNQLHIQSGAGAWHDPHDSKLKVSLSEKLQRRKLRELTHESEIDGDDYEARLRKQFQKLHPTPQWSIDNRRDVSIKRDGKRRRSLSLSKSESDPEDSLQAQSSGIANSTKYLAPGTLEIERLRDANQSVPAKGSVHSVAFHPNVNVPVLITASSDRNLRFFNIDGHTNPHLQSIHLTDLPLTGALFHPSGASVLLTGPRPFYYRHDLQSGSTSRSFVRQGEGNDIDRSMERRAFSPDGKILAMAGRNSYIRLLDWSNSGGGHIITSLKSSSAIKDLHWNRSGTELWTLGSDSVMYIWDIRSRKCVSRWIDDGGYGTSLFEAGSDCLATGSTSGFVSIYDLSKQSIDSAPKILKTIGNLTTPITTLCFNAGAQILAMGSDAKKNQVRLLHLPSLTVFANWPTAGSPIGTVRDIAFSPGTHYMALGNKNGRTLLYNLSHFGHGLTTE